ncbi:MAG TPA: hypothetical protein VFX58_19160 [Chitinophagaceae bacterium]|nr:hypothetical protein [Chitinophagaceae bacterium]
MKLSLARFIISFVGFYFALIINLVVDKSAGRDYLMAIPFALVLTLLFELLYKNLIDRKKKKKTSE